MKQDLGCTQMFTEKGIATIITTIIIITIIIMAEMFMPKRMYTNLHQDMKLVKAMRTLKEEMISEEVITDMKEAEDKITCTPCKKASSIDEAFFI